MKKILSILACLLVVFVASSQNYSVIDSSSNKVGNLSLISPIVTNYVTVPVYKTNFVTVPIYQTNFVTVPVYQTNIVYVTNGLPSVNIPPTVAITSPANNASFLSPASVTINANATDSDGTINKVEFYIDNTLANVDLLLPYSYTTMLSSTGKYNFQAKAYDNSNAIVSSAIVGIFITNIPVIIPPITNPPATGIIFYVKAGANGSQNGSDWNNAYSSLPSTLVRGATYYISGGTYSGYSFNTANNGTSLITIRKATIADHGNNTGWVDILGTSQALFGSMTFVTDYYVIDGVTGGGPGQWQNNLGIKIKSGGFNISFTGNRTKIQLLHMDVENNGRADARQNEHSFYATGGVSDIRVAYSYWHDVSICFFFTRGANRITVEYSKFARNGQAEWIDGLHRTAWSATTDNNMIIRNCIFEDICNTAVFSIVNGSGNADGWKIYGNVIVWTGNYQDAYCSALIDVRNDNALGVSPAIINMVASNWEVYNNNIINWIGGSSAGSRIGAGSNNKIYNNIWYKNIANEISMWNSSANYNWYYGNIRTEGCNPPCSKDIKVGANDIIGTSDPFVDWKNGNFQLKKSIGTGIPTPFTTDAFGKTRGADGNWDIGAYEF